MTAFVRWFTTGGAGVGGRPPVAEAIVLRAFGVVWLLVSVIGTFATRPHPGFHGRGAVVLASLIALIAAAVSTQPQRLNTGVRARVASLVAVTIAAAVLGSAQPDGIWQAGPVFVGIIAAVLLERRTAFLVFGFSLAVTATVAVINGHGRSVVSLVLTAIPWFLVMRLVRRLRDQRDELDASRAAEAQAAAAAERGRLAREMHDVLAHSLSALALQLESTRLLARSRGVEREVARAIDQAHHLAAGGLEEARRAIATERGDELPGPERIGVLADAFKDQSGLPVDVEVRGDARELPPRARLAVYRTAQEALTNVRRHASAERVEVKLDCLPDRTVLVVEDHAVAGAPPPAALGLTGSGYGLTGMRERAELLGGELLAAPTSRGFRVELRLPTVG